MVKAILLTRNRKDAADLQTGDSIRSRNEEDVGIKDVKFSYKPRKVYNFEVSNWHTYFVGALQWLVHNAESCLRQYIIKVSENTYDLILKYKKGWTKFQKKAARRKVKALTEAETKVTKRPIRKPGTKRRFEKAGGKIKKGEDVDHVHDLQLGGIDNPSNMSGLDRSVNRSLGKQINHRVKKPFKWSNY